MEKDTDTSENELSDDQQTTNAKDGNNESNVLAIESESSFEMVSDSLSDCNKEIENIQNEDSNEEVDELVKVKEDIDSQPTKGCIKEDLSNDFMEKIDTIEENKTLTFNTTEADSHANSKIDDKTDYVNSNIEDNEKENNIGNNSPNIEMDVKMEDKDNNVQEEQFNLDNIESITVVSSSDKEIESSSTSTGQDKPNELKNSVEKPETQIGEYYQQLKEDFDEKEGNYNTDINDKENINLDKEVEAQDNIVIVAKDSDVNQQLHVFNPKDIDDSGDKEAENNYINVDDNISFKLNSPSIVIENFDDNVKTSIGNEYIEDINEFELDTHYKKGLQRKTSMRDTSIKSPRHSKHIRFNLEEDKSSMIDDVSKQDLDKNVEKTENDEVFITDIVIEHNKNFISNNSTKNNKNKRKNKKKRKRGKKNAQFTQNQTLHGNSKQSLEKTGNLENEDNGTEELSENNIDETNEKEVIYKNLYFFFLLTFFRIKRF